MGNKIKILRDELVYDGKFIQVIVKHFIGGQGYPGVWETVRRKTQGNIVSIAAITPEREIILEKIFRVPVNDYVLELPAGLMDKAGEIETETIMRELLEETGYQVDSVEELTRGPFNAGLLADNMVVFLGINARAVQEPQLENPEDIEIIKIPLNNLFDYLLAHKEVKADLKIASIIPHLQRRGLLI